MKRRMLAAAAAAMLAGGLAATAASPAYADDGEADLAVTVTGTTIAAGAPGKFATLTLTNHGPGDASGIVFSYDVSDLDTSKVEFELPAPAEGDPCEPNMECIVLGLDSLQSGGKVDLDGILSKVDGATGDAGSITVEVWHDGTDPDPSNNSVTVPVTIGESGPDLLVFAPDVHHEASLEDPVEELDSLILPGSGALVWVFLQNQGDQPAHGLEIAASLPDHVSFFAESPVCDHAAGDTTTTCTLEEVTLIPAMEDESSECDVSSSCLIVAFRVVVSEEAPSPASLTGGVVQAHDLGLQPMFGIQSIPSVPDIVQTGLSLEVDPTDNVSNFTVFVSEILEEEADNGQAGGVDKLPVTGIQAGLIGLVGAVALAAGALLLLVARRRRGALLKGLDE